MDALFQYGFQGVIAFGAVGAIALVLEKRYKYILSSEYKLYLLIGIAFLAGFVPTDLGNAIFNQIKIAVGVAFGVNAINTSIKRFGSN
jgi:hypothetical protein